MTQAAMMVPAAFSIDVSSWCAEGHLRPMSTFDQDRRCDLCRGGELVPDAPLVPIRMPPEDAYVEVEYEVRKRWHLTAEDFESPQEWAAAYWSAKERDGKFDFDEVTDARDPSWEDPPTRERVYAGVYQRREAKSA